MSDLHHMLSNLPECRLPAGFSYRMRQEFHAHHQRYQRFQGLLSFVLVTLGIWQAVPALIGWAANIHLPSNTLPIVSALVKLASNFSSSLPGAWGGVTNFQGSFVIQFGWNFWVGLLALGLGAILGLHLLLPSNRI